MSKTDPLLLQVEATLLETTKALGRKCYPSHSTGANTEHLKFAAEAHRANVEAYKILARRRSVEAFFGKMLTIVLDAVKPDQELRDQATEMLTEFLKEMKNKAKKEAALN